MSVAPFRPCIDLRDGKVVQIVGGSLESGRVRSNFESEKPAGYFASLYRQDQLAGGHVIALGPGNETAARSALAAWPRGLQYGGGVTEDNAKAWLEAGAEKVIVTSWLFEGATFRRDRAEALALTVGPERLVFDLSCRPFRSETGETDYFVMSERWKTRTDLRLDEPTFRGLASLCSEFLVHAVDVEGKQAGPDDALIELLALRTSIPVTYAGGIRSLDDIERLERIGGGRIGYTVGSALDIFGGTGLKYEELVKRGR